MTKQSDLIKYLLPNIRDAFNKFKSHTGKTPTKLVMRTSVHTIFSEELSKFLYEEQHIDKFMYNGIPIIIGDSDYFRFE